ncbi:MAG: ABC transporter permease [Armatimonadota bacterium]
MISNIREFIKYKDLLKQLVIRDLKVRYKNSVLGFFWSLANPLIQAATITIIVKFVMKVDIANYSAFVLIGFLPWIFFQMALLDSSQVFLMHRDLLKKVYFPRETLALSVVISNLIHFCLSLAVFFVYLGVYYFFLSGSPLLKTTLLLPVIMLFQTLLIIGLTFFISTLNVFFEDTKYIVSALLNVFFYLTPIMYPVELVYDSLKRFPAYHNIIYKIYMLIPMNTLTDTYRKALVAIPNVNVGGEKFEVFPLDYGMFAICGIICTTVAFLGYRFFIKRAATFAERL